MFPSVASEPAFAQSADRRSRLVVAVAFLLCVFEIVWFWRYCGRNITADAISYIGLARHLRDGHFVASLHGYWSPLISWLIAAAGIFISDWTLAGRVVTIATLLAVFPLLYALTYKLWRSHLAAAVALLWFALARGVIAMAVTTILADFLLTAIVCVYFTLLLSALRRNLSRDWFFLGAAHAAAFLAKAIAMPWFAMTTLLAVFLTRRKSLRQMTGAACLALILPACAWLADGSLLKLKYGYFTTGYQLRRNLIVDSRRHNETIDPYQFTESSQIYDQYLVTEAPQAELRAFRMLNPALVPVVLSGERHNLPEAIKQLIILLTPGGVLSLAVILWRLLRYRDQFAAEFRFAVLVLVSSATLLLAYCMLVFDWRYVIPLIPPLMTIASLPLVPGSRGYELLDPGPALRKTLLLVLAAGAVFFQVYWASPFRTISRDFEIPCYNAARALKTHQADGKTLVTVGEGPFPDQGVGREAGIYTAYFAHRRILGYNVALPDVPRIPNLVAQIIAPHADAVLVWGSPARDRYRFLLETIGRQMTVASTTPITDPQKGEVGRILFAPISK